MKELTFIEVFANIKDGQVWERVCDGNRRIRKINSEIIIENTDKYKYHTMSDNDFTKYRLVRQEYSFQEAFEAFENGEEIESVENNWRWKKDTDNTVWLLTPHGGGTPEHPCRRIFSIDEIKGKWYINK